MYISASRGRRQTGFGKVAPNRELLQLRDFYSRCASISTVQCESQPNEGVKYLAVSFQDHLGGRVVQSSILAPEGFWFNTCSLNPRLGNVRKAIHHGKKQKKSPAKPCVDYGSSDGRLTDEPSVTLFFFCFFFLSVGLRSQDRPGVKPFLQ